MIKIMQTIVDPINGNCFQACVASLFELQLNDVPHFLLKDKWWDSFNDWLLQFGLIAVDTVINEDSRAEWLKYLDRLNCFALSTIRSGPLYHTVVIKGSKIIHNPFPGYRGDNCEQLADFQLITLIDPSKTIKLLNQEGK